MDELSVCAKDFRKNGFQSRVGSDGMERACLHPVQDLPGKGSEMIEMGGAHRVNNIPVDGKIVMDCDIPESHAFFDSCTEMIRAAVDGSRKTGGSIYESPLRVLGNYVIDIFVQMLTLCGLQLKKGSRLASLSCFWT
ncbi:hypothetical protein [Desulfoplanes sp.]